MKTKYLIKLKNGDKFKTPTGTEAILIEKGIGQCKVLITKRTKSREWYTADGKPDSYWFGYQNWSPQTEVRRLDE